MKTHKVCLLVALMMMLVACSSKLDSELHTVEPKTYTGTIPEKINAYYDHNKSKAYGVLVGVFDSDTIIHKGYYGFENETTDTRVSESTVMDWGSSTKLLVWVSVMQLYEQGKLDLHADIKTYLPDGFLTNLRYDKPLTMIDLMNHRAGFQDYYRDLMIPKDDQFLSLHDALLVEQPAQVFEPDTLTGYSNWGAALAGYIVERVADMSFCDYVHKHIFEPLDMNDAAIAPDLMDNPSVRTRRDKLMCYDSGPIGTAFYIIQLYPAGSCVSTLDDYIKFARCFVKEQFPLFKKQETFTEMISASSFFGDTDIPKNAHGFWAIPVGTNTLGHGGNTQGCSANLVFDADKKIGCVVMTNCRYETTFNNDMLELIFGEINWNASISSDMPNGLVRSARTILEGRYKILRESYILSNMLNEVFWIYNENNGIKKIEAPYGDYYFVSFGQVIVSYVLFYGWELAIVFSVITLAISLMRRIVRAIWKKEKRKMASWIFLSCIVQVLIAAFAIVFVAMFSTWQSSHSYNWTFKVVVCLGIALLALAITGLVKTIKQWNTTKVLSKIFRITTLLFSFVTVFMIVYMDLWK